jgi:hypothetical protein
MKKIIYCLMTALWILSCDDNDSYSTGRYFSLSETQVSFDSRSGEKSVGIIHPQGTTGASVIPDNSAWCTAAVDGNQVIIRVTENILFESRTAKVRVTSGNAGIEIMVRQGRKYFDHIPAVKNLQAVPGPGEVTLRWEEPAEDNFSHVVISYYKNGEAYKITLPNGVTEYTVKELLNEHGTQTFFVQSIDKENDPGEISEIAAIPNKLVAFRFEKEAGTQWTPYYLRTSDTQTLTLQVGSMEYNRGEKTTVALETAPDLLDAYNRDNGTEIPPLPANTYTLPGDFVHEGATAYQDLTIEVTISTLQDRSLYALPVRIKSASPATVSDMMSSMVILFCVEDLQGWYTVDRLPNCGEGESAYPADAKDRRRYIKRTGETTWETGYLFRSYVNNEEHTGSGTSVQYISIDPQTKTIFMQQDSYSVGESHNGYDFTTNELHIEYLYSDWAGWWTHERMYNRSLTK